MIYNKKNLGFALPLGKKFTNFGPTQAKAVQPCMNCSCLFFRYYMHGVTLGALGLAIILTIVLIIVVHRLVNREEKQITGNGRTNNTENENIKNEKNIEVEVDNALPKVQNGEKF